MSDEAKHAGVTVAKVGAVIAALGLLWRIGEHVATVAAKFGTVTESVKGIGEKTFLKMKPQLTVGAPKADQS